MYRIKRNWFRFNCIPMDYYKVIYAIPQTTQRLRKDVVKTFNFGLKDVLDWPEMEVATTLFLIRPQDIFQKTSLRPP